MTLQLVWFKRDLRVDDHRPLAMAAQAGPVLGLYVVEPELLDAPESHPRHWAFILASLQELRRGLRARGSDLWVRRGEAVEVLDRLTDALPVGRILSHEETGLDVTYQRDLRVKAWSRGRGIPWVEVPQFGVIRGLKDRDGWARQWSLRMNEAPLAPTDAFPPLPETVGPEDAGRIPSLEELGMAWTPLAAHQPGGEDAGHETLGSFLQARGVNYRADMASPVTGWDGCSRLSPHLAYGTLSMRRVHHATTAARTELERRRKDGDPTLDRRWIPSLRSFEKRLRWHCHFIQKLESEPAIEFHAMNRAYDHIRTPDPAAWSSEEAARFAAWRDGRTGYPMVDACMRALEATGWMNFRMRAMLVSFAAYHLWLDWRPVARELARRFLDFEAGIHISQCQMQSGVTGINQLRIYSPSKQVTDNDPRGRFIRRWVPELAHVPDEYLPQPEAMSGSLQGRVGCIIGRDYPAPLVDHKTAVREARRRMGEVRGSDEARRLAREVYRRHGSRRRSPPRSTAKKPDAQLGLEL